MPRITGLQLLRSLKDKPDLKDVPVIMFTTSNAEQDIMQARKLGASGYVIKPNDVASTVEFVKLLHDCWLRSEQPAYWPAAMAPV